jgi:hypothetical protein
MNASRMSSLMLVGIGLSIAACGGSAEAPDQQEAADSAGGGVDVAAIESNLTKLAGDSGADEVDCPDDVPAEAGASFDCEVSGPDGVEGTMSVTLDDAEGKGYSYEGKISGPGGLETELTGSAR